MDDTVNLLDVAILLNQILEGSDMLNGMPLDMTNDGEVDILDIIGLLMTLN